MKASAWSAQIYAQTITAGVGSQGANRSLLRVGKLTHGTVEPVYRVR